MAGTTATVQDVYNNTEVLKTKVDDVSKKLSDEQLVIKDLQDQVKKLQSVPIIG
jgi:hypothetical protein